jgi:hypothetical protein
MYSLEKPKKNQKKLVLEHLEKGKAITQQGAIETFQCYRLASVINKLRDKGHNIKTELVYYNGKRFAKYSL